MSAIVGQKEGVRRRKSVSNSRSVALGFFREDKMRGISRSAGAFFLRAWKEIGVGIEERMVVWIAAAQGVEIDATAAEGNLGAHETQRPCVSDGELVSEHECVTVGVGAAEVDEI